MKENKGENVKMQYSEKVNAVLIDEKTGTKKKVG